MESREGSQRAGAILDGGRARAVSTTKATKNTKFHEGFGAVRPTSDEPNGCPQLGDTVSAGVFARTHLKPSRPACVSFVAFVSSFFASVYGHMYVAVDLGRTGELTAK